MLRKIPWLPVDEVRRICVFRALVLGDLLCAQPALRALRAGFPSAEITLVGLPWAQALAPRLGPVDDFVPCPGWPGLPESAPRLSAVPDFLAMLQARRFDLALQLHGSGAITNPLVASFGARRTAAFVADGGWAPDPALAVPWPERGHEIERCLALTDHLGLPRDGLELSLDVTPRERAAAAALAGTRPYVLVHPGAQLRSRRWPPERFAAVADALADEHLAVLLTGTAGEAGLVDEVMRCMRRPARSLAGRTSVGELAALVARAELVVCNDTGISHVAAAMRTPSVVVASGSDVARWAPLDAARHRVLWQGLPCRPCAHERCPTAHECALAIAPEQAIETALDLLETPWPDRSNSLDAGFASSPGTSTATTSTTSPA